jgi:peptide/nickel transport system permease protein
MPEHSPDIHPHTSPFDTGADSAVEVYEEAVLGEALVPDELTLEMVGGAVAPPTEFQRKKLGFGAWLAIGWLVTISALAILAPILPIKDRNAQDVSCLVNGVPKGPSSTHPLGCDGIGRDLLSLNIWGARSSLVIGVGAVLFGFIVGGAFGLAAGYYRGRRDTVITSGFDVMLAFPQIVLAILLVTVLASGENVTATRREFAIILAIGIVSVPVLGRITRANALSWSQREFVLAARAQGAKNQRIMWREVLPNVLPAMFSIALLGIAVAIVAEGGLSIFGLGTQLPTPSWGNIISQGVRNLERAPHVVLGASMFIFFTVLSLNFLGDVVRDYFDVRESLL